MQVDRARFLLLTMSISAGACAPTEPPSAPGAEPRSSPPVVNVAPPDDRPVALLATDPESSHATPSEDPAAAGQAPIGDGAGLDPGQVAAGREGNDTVNPFAAGDPPAGLRGQPFGGPSSGIIDPFATGRSPIGGRSQPSGGHSSGLINPFATGNPPASQLAQQCRQLKPPPGPQCESFDTTVPECEAYERALVPDAAERAVRCLSKKSGTAAICKFGVTADCFLQGARGTKTVPEAQRLCGPTVAACAGQRWREADLGAPNCLAAVSATRPERRGMLISCIAESCGIANCYYAIESG